MKTLHSVKYILLALIVLGCFANFAQNEYGFRIVYWSLIALFLVFLLDTIYYGIKEKQPFPQKRPSRKIRLILSTIGILTGFSLFFYSFSGDGALFIGIAGFILMISSILAIISMESQIKPLFIESMSLLLYLTSMLFKYNHFLGAGALMILSSILLISYFTAKSIMFFKSEKKQNLQAAWFFQFLFLFIIFNLLATLFKAMHWPGAGLIGYVDVLLLLIIGVYLILRKKFAYSASNISSWKLVGKIKGNFSLIFIFFIITSIYWVLLIAHIAPRFYSNAIPSAMMRLENEENAKYEKYSHAYNNFLEYRRANENKEK